MITQPEVLERMIQSKTGSFSPELAHQILDMGFPDTDKTRYEVLAIKARGGSLTSEERQELENYVNLNTFLMIIQSKARVVLKQTV